MPPCDVQRDEFGTVTGVTDYATVPDDELSTLDTELNAIKVPGPEGGIIKPQGFTTAVELVPTLTYDATADTFTTLATGVVYTDNGVGILHEPRQPRGRASSRAGSEYRRLEELHARIITDSPIVRDPFIPGVHLDVHLRLPHASC